jgi:hypothetical protein
LADAKLHGRHILGSDFVSSPPATQKPISGQRREFRENVPKSTHPITRKPRWLAVPTHRLGQHEAEHLTRKFAEDVGGDLVAYPKLRQRCLVCARVVIVGQTALNPLSWAFVDAGLDTQSVATNAPEANFVPT